MVKIIKNKYITQMPNNEIWFNTTHQGKRKEISKSKIRKSIPTKKNLTEKGTLDDPKGSNPHSYTDTFSISGNLTPTI